MKIKLHQGIWKLGENELPIRRAYAGNLETKFTRVLVKMQLLSFKAKIVLDICTHVESKREEKQFSFKMFVYFLILTI